LKHLEELTKNSNHATRYLKNLAYWHITFGFDTFKYAKVLKSMEDEYKHFKDISIR